MFRNTTQPIMIVEDSDDDFEATQRALKKEGVLYNPIIRFDNGADALAYLKKNGHPGDDKLRPGVVLLDLNMPGMDGREVLSRVKSDPDINDIPIVILTTSDDEMDVDTCYRAGANTYVKKPVNLENFFQAVQRMKTYWLEVALLPKEKA
jgi:CheY-like chemotaxis protein